MQRMTKLAQPVKNQGQERVNNDKPARKALKEDENKRKKGRKSWNRENQENNEKEKEINRRSERTPPVLVEWNRINNLIIDFPIKNEWTGENVKIMKAIFFNHACPRSPLLNSKIELWTCEGFAYLVFFSTRDIQLNEEIYFSYCNDKHSFLKWGFTCKCGSLKCYSLTA